MRTPRRGSPVSRSVTRPATLPNRSGTSAMSTSARKASQTTKTVGLEPFQCSSVNLATTRTFGPEVISSKR